MSNEQYKERGPCCDYYEDLQAKARVHMKVIHTLLGGNPRYLVMYAENLKRSGRAGLITLGMEGGKHCPCHDAPDSQRFRAFFSVLLQHRGEGAGLSFEKASEKINGLAEEFLEREDCDNGEVKTV